MGNNSKIQWTDHTWNIARGCTKVDADCLYCYMYRQSLNDTRYVAKDVVKTKTVFRLPLTIKEPSRIFTSSLTDVFHPKIDPYRHEMWDIIRACPQHTFQILTKRPERVDFSKGLIPNEFFKNVWLGTSIGSAAGITRGHQLVYSSVPVRLKFLSLEPLHERIKIGHLLRRIKWVIIGGESGNDNGKYRYRECQVEWIESIISECKRANVPVFVKQLGTHLAKKMGLKDRHGGDITEWPQYLQIRQFPS